MTDAQARLKACERCAVLEDLLETATSERDMARDESRKADEETLALKVRDVSKLANDMTGSYAAIKAFQHRAKVAEAALARMTRTPDAQPSSTDEVERVVSFAITMFRAFLVGVECNKGVRGWSRESSDLSEKAFVEALNDYAASMVTKP
jgi:hypothetical protein